MDPRIDLYIDRVLCRRGGGHVHHVRVGAARRARGTPRCVTTRWSR
jgi:hypothetical protein